MGLTGGRGLMADRRSVFKGVGSRRREDGLRTKEHDVVGKRKVDVAAGDQRRNSRRGDVDQYALISDLRNQGLRGGRRRPLRRHAHGTRVAPARAAQGCGGATARLPCETGRSG